MPSDDNKLISQVAAQMGRRGGTATALKMTPEQRSAKSSKAAKKRWAAYRKKKAEAAK